MSFEVFLVPVGNARYELYCEPPDEPVVEAGGPRRGFLRRTLHRFREALAAVERERRQTARGTPGEPAAQAEPVADAGWRQRFKARTLRWMAESIAEQRLLWHLRRQGAAVLVYPADLVEPDAEATVRTVLRRDHRRHRRWFAIDLLGFVGSGLLTPLPGPNLVAWYFLFRFVGHFLAMRGARQGLDRVAWQARSSGELAELRKAATLAPAAREDVVQKVSAQLRLQHLATFFQRTAIPETSAQG